MMYPSVSLLIANFLCDIGVKIYVAPGIQGRKTISRVKSERDNAEAPLRTSAKNGKNTPTQLVHYAVYDPSQKAAEF